MGPTVSSMFSHAAHHAAAAAPVSGTTLVAVVLLALAAVAALLLRRGSGPAGGPARARSRRAGGRGLGRAIQALGAPGAAGGPTLRVLSRLALGPGRYLSMVEAGDRVILVAVGGEVRLLGEVGASSLPRSRRHRQAMARQLLAERVAAVDGAGRGDGSVLEFPARSLPVPSQAGAQEERSVRGADGESATPATAQTAALLERYLATAAPTDGGRMTDGEADEREREAAEYFSSLLQASIERMEAAEARILPTRPRPARPGGRTSPAPDDWAEEGAGL